MVPPVRIRVRSPSRSVRIDAFDTFWWDYGTMLPLSAPGVCFRQKPDVDYALPPSREAISFLSSGVLWRDDTRLPEDDPVRVALELRAEEDGVECDFVRRDLHDAERVEELPSGLAELLREHVVRGLVVEDAARHPLQGRAEVAQDP